MLLLSVGCMEGVDEGGGMSAADDVTGVAALGGCEPSVKKCKAALNKC